MKSVRMSHIGLCVSDRAWSLRFFTEGLGFELAAAYAFGDEGAAIAEMQPGGVEGESTMIDKDGTRLELLSYPSPGTRGAPSKVRNQLGLTHLCFEVDSIAETTARLVSLGATVIEPSRTHVDKDTYTVDMLIVADRDGNRIELLERHATS